MASLINDNLEFVEVLNAFPILRDKLEKSRFNLNDLKDGITIKDYLQNKSYREDEIDILVKKLNNDVQNYLKKADRTNSEKKQIEITNIGMQPLQLEEEDEEEE